MKRDDAGWWQNPDAVLSAALPSMSVALSAETIGDPEATRTVYTTVVILVVLGVVMLVLAIWMFRRTRPEMQLLAPLEVMDSRRWRRSEPAQRGRELDEKRPPGARPLRRAAERPLKDTEFDTTQPVRSFDDLAPGAEQTYRLSDATAPVARRSHDAADPTPTDEDALDLPISAALTSVASTEISHPDDLGDDSTTEQPRLATTADDADLDDQGADEELDADADDVHDGPDSDPEGLAADDLGEADTDGDVLEPVMPGEGLLRRSHDPSS